MWFGGYDVNFEHEISDIKDRNLRFFFAYDYFHDGTIHNIQVINDKSIWNNNIMLSKMGRRVYPEQRIFYIDERV